MPEIQEHTPLYKPMTIWEDLVMNRDGIETHFDPNLDKNDENRDDNSHNVDNGVENDCVERVTDFLMNDTLDET